MVEAAEEPRVRVLDLSEWELRAYVESTEVILEDM